LRLWFAEQKDERSEEEKRFYLKRNWTPPPKYFPECDVFWKRINEKLDKWKPPKRINSNLSRLENEGKKFVTKDTSHVYKVEDKGS
jgi:acid phosphatase class B